MVRKVRGALVLSLGLTWASCGGTPPAVTAPTTGIDATRAQPAANSTAAAATPSAPKPRAAKPPPPDASCELATSGPGEKLGLKQYLGKVVVLDFWATFCEPCKKSFPKLQDLYQRYRQEGLVVVGASEDDEREAIGEFVQTYGAKFDTCWDKDHATAEAFKVSTMPSSYVVDRRGRVRFVHAGYHDGEEVDVEAQVKQLLSER
jgi:peroxiredoxin